MPPANCLSLCHSSSVSTMATFWALILLLRFRDGDFLNGGGVVAAIVDPATPLDEQSI